MALHHGSHTLPHLVTDRRAAAICGQPSDALVHAPEEERDRHSIR
jgi:hypothetical protein